jgi:hypothetical protein
MIATTLPILMALSWVPVASTLPVPVTTTMPQKAQQPAQQNAERITCPITGQQIPACCCPLKE